MILTFNSRVYAVIIYQLNQAIENDEVTNLICRFQQDTAEWLLISY